MKRKFFIRNFLLIAMPAVLAVVLMGCVAIGLTYNNTQKSIQDHEQQAVGRIKDSVEVILSEADAQSLNYSVSPYIMVKLNSLLENGYMGKEQLDIAYMLRPFIDSNVNSKPFLHSVYIYLNNDNGNFFASMVGLANQSNFSDVEWLKEVNDEDFTKEQWFERRNISAYMKSSYSVDIVTLYKRLYGSVYSKPIGVLVMNIRTEYLEELMEGYLNYDGQEIMLTTSDGAVLCQVGNPDAMREPCYYAQEQSVGYGLSYISYVPKKAGWQIAMEMIKMVGIFITISLIFSMILAYLVTRRNARNVERVIQLFELAERGEKLPEITEKANDEYSYIIQNVVRNYVEKNYLQMQLTEKKYSLDKMYYSFLQSQLGPHFLFNTLKTIFWKTVAMTGGPNDTSRMLDRLTNLLYYALVRPDKYVKVSEEVKMTKSYLEIQQIRFEYNFHVVWDFEADVEEYDVIKFVLQPLLDNSITHGLAEKEGGGEIRISIWEDGRLNFSVQDNGVGLSKEKLDEIKDSLKKETPPSDSIGLYNLNRRLILTYGEEAGLIIESTPMERTVVQFSVPVEGGEQP